MSAAIDDASPSLTTRDAALDFISLGYLPHIASDWRAQAWANVAVDPTTASLDDIVLRAGAGTALEEAVGGTLGSTNVVLLSGGNDSRAILGALLSTADAKSIVAVTYGTPGSFDYDIPVLLARETGVRHVRMDLTQHRFTEEQLIDVAQELADRPMWLFGPLMNRLVTKEFGRDATYWSGYLGGPATGSHHPKEGASRTCDAAVERHFGRPGFGRSHRFLPESFKRGTSIGRSQPCFTSPLSLDEQVDLVVRQHPWLYREHVVEGYDYRTPLTDAAFLALMFNAGASRRQGQALYLAMLAERYPRLFLEMPHKDHFGLPPDTGRLRRELATARLRGRRAMHWLTRGSPRFARPSVNHIDWDHGFRRRKDLVSLAENLLPALAERQTVPDVDVLHILHGHRDGRFDAGLLLSHLVSLEIYYRQGIE